jgi:DNA-binding NtrC family response regulator
MNQTTAVNFPKGSRFHTERRVLVVDDEANARAALKELLTDEGYIVQTAPDGFKALGVLREWPCDVLITDLRMPVMDGLSLLRKVSVEFEQITSIVMTAFGTVENAVEAMQSGAEDYLTKPLNFDAVELVLERAFERLELRAELETLRKRAAKNDTGTQMIGTSMPMQKLKHMIEQVANSRATILISGESGTGKELVAKQIHEHSERSDGPFVALHCAALSESLLESELFGHEKGAFTGANVQRQGRFEEAAGGTLFLDEIGEISPSLQVKLLRFLQEREFERVGGNKTISVDVRIVAATNRDLEEEVRSGKFREDLYYRLNVIHLKAPPLRTRRSDIALLVRHFAAQYAKRNQKSIEGISPDVLELMTSYDWPGNVRELENVIEHTVVLADSPHIEVRHLPDGFGESRFLPGAEIRIPGSTIEDIERYAILKTYEATGGNSSETAGILNISVRKVQYKLKEYQQGDQ